MTMSDNPLVPNQDAANEAHAQKMHALGAQARTPSEWFDIYTETVEFMVKTTMEAHGDGALALERLRERRHHAKTVRSELESHGMPLSEEVQIEGPIVSHDERGIPSQISWPAGEWIKLYWPDGSKLQFAGPKALIALGFVMWWESYHTMFKQLTDPSSVKPKSRLIEQYSPEWHRYMDGKNGRS